MGENSYPIEIGWVDEEGIGESHLICPNFDWIDWSDEAEALHRIERYQLIKEGRPAVEIATRLKKASLDKRLISDGPEFDRYWLSVLFGGVDYSPPTLIPVQTAYAEALKIRRDFAALQANRAQLAKQLLLTCEKEEVARNRPRHRALPDAEGMLWIWQKLKESS